MALKRKCSSAQVCNSHQSTSSTSSTDVGEENEIPMRKMRRMDCCETSPAVFHKCFKSVSEESDSQEGQWRKFSSIELRSLHWSSSSGQGQTTAAISERHAEDETRRTSFTIDRKRSAQVCDSHQSTSSTSSTDVAENHQPVSVGEENEIPMRKKRRVDSLKKLPALFWNWSNSSDQDTPATYERHTEDQNSLQDIACARLEDPQEPLSSGLEVLPPEGQPVETLPVSPAPGLNNNRVDVTTEDEFMAITSNITLTSLQATKMIHLDSSDNILSRYEIGRMLGEGGFGSVFEGKRLEDGLEVAVKIARKPKNMKYIYIPGHPAPLPLEIALLVLVNNGPKVQEIIELLDWQDQPEQYILVLERPSPCKDLLDFLNFYDGTLNEDMARFIMMQTTMAADMCCRRGVFHRDIKLENLLINTESLEVKLIDFGCGDLLQEFGYEQFCGTPYYSPPEFIVEGKYHGKPATVWSLGVLLFVLVCGRYPEPRDRRMIDDNTWSMPGLSNECCHLIRSLLQESPVQRIDLRKILQHEWFKDTE